MRRIWKSSEKEKAIELRKQELSYGQINKRLGVPKSTLHVWFRDSALSQKVTELNKKLWIKEIQPLGAQGQRRKRKKMIASIIEKVKKDVNMVCIDTIAAKAMLSLLYWAEGTKVRGVLTFANTDPRLNLLFVTLLRKSYDIDESKFRLRLHLHHYHDEEKTKVFWSKLLNISEAQFNKTYHKQRSKEKKFRRNFGGICFIRYNSVYLKEEIVRYAFALGERITGKIDVPVA